MGRTGHPPNEATRPASLASLSRRPGLLVVITSLPVPTPGSMGRSTISKGAASSRPKRQTKIPKKWDPSGDGVQSDNSAENDDPAWRQKKSRLTAPTPPASPPQKPMQEQQHAGDMEQHCGVLAALVPSKALAKRPL